MLLLCLLGLGLLEAAAPPLRQGQVWQAWQKPCRSAGSRPEQVVQPDEVVGSPGNGFVIDYANLTVMGRKAWDLLATMQQPQRPHCFAMVEAHLAGQHLNAARRRLRSLGWKSLHTPAVPKLTALTGQISGFGQDHDGAGYAAGVQQNESAMILGGLAPSASHESPDIVPKIVATIPSFGKVQKKTKGISCRK